MCTTDFSLKLIAASCLLIIFTDSFVLQEIIQKSKDFKSQTDPIIYLTCYEPQIQLRVVFTLYAINAAGICFMLTVALMIFDEFSQNFNTFVAWIVEYMFVIFGPVMMTLCLLGLSKIPLMKQKCDLNDQINMVDLFIIVCCILVSAAITFSYSLQKTNKLAEESLQNESSAMYQVFITFLKRKRSNYQEERRILASNTAQNSNPVYGTL